MARPERTIGPMTTREDVRFRAGDLTLAGTLTLPEPIDGVRAPWAVLVPSWLPRDRDGSWDVVRHPAWFRIGPPRAGILSRIADALAERGVASVRYDPRGCGESDGTWEDSDLFARIDDARDAIGAMRSRPELDLRRTAIVGHGEGAVIAVSVAISDPAIGAIGLVGAPARSFRDVLRRGVSARTHDTRDREHPAVAALDRFAEELIERVERREREVTLPIGGEDTALALAGWDQAFRTPLAALATMLHRNVVVAHGSDDAWAHPDETAILAGVLRASGNDPAVQVVEGGDHELRDAPDVAIKAFAAALAERMQPRELPPVLVAIEEMGSR